MLTLWSTFLLLHGNLLSRCDEVRREQWEFAIFIHVVGDCCRLRYNLVAVWIVLSPVMMIYTQCSISRLQEVVNLDI